MNLFSPPGSRHVGEDVDPKPTLAPEPAAELEDGMAEPSMWVNEKERFAKGRFASKSESFQMAPIEMMPPPEEEGPAVGHKRLSQMFAKGVIDEDAIDKRVQGFMIEQQALLAQLVTKSARFDPESRRYRWLLVTMIMLCAYSTSATGYYIGFNKHFEALHAGCIVGWLIDLLFVANFFVQSSVGFIDVEGTKVMDQHRSRLQYIHSIQFVCDLVALLPLDIFQFATGWNAWWRFNKLFRVYAMWGYLHKLQKMSVNPRTINLIVFARLLVIWLLMPHAFCCVRLIFIQMDDIEDPWKNLRRNLDPNVPQITNYLRNLHWCMGVMSGYSDGTVPEKVHQYLFTLCVLNIGLFTFAYTVGVIGAMNEGNAAQSRDFQITVSSMAKFVKRYELPPTMQKRLTDYFSHRWECIKSNEKELVMAAKLLEELPPCVRYDAVECMTAEALAKVPLFARVEEGFIHALTQKMVAIMTSVGELLVTQGQVCDGLYIVLKGKLSIHVNGAQVNVIGVGSVVGEQSMLTGLPANATVTSLSFCEIYMLARGPFEELQHKFSDTFEGFKQAARLEAKNARKANKVKKGGKAGKMGGGAMGGADDPNDRKSMRGKLQRAATRTIIGGSDGDGRKLLGIVPIPILPHSRTRAVWAGLLLIFLTYDLLSLPFKLVFIGNYVDSGICALDVMSDLVIIADLIARSVLAFSEDGRLIDDVKLIRKRYFVRWRFIPLCISAVPTSMFLPLYPLIDARILQSLRVLRVVRRFSGSHDAHSRQQPSNLEELLRQIRTSEFDLQFAINKLAPLLAMYIVCVHYVACGYWMVVTGVLKPGNVNDAQIPTWVGDNATAIAQVIDDSRWLPDENYLTTGNILLYYFRAFYFATCNLTGLGAAVVPYKVSAVCFTLGCFIMGVMVFAYLTSAIVTLVMQADAAADNFKNTTMQLLSFMKDAGIEHDVTMRSSKWLNQWWFAHGGTNINNIMDKLPPTLSSEIRAHCFMTAAKQSSFWVSQTDQSEVVSYEDMFRLAQDIRFEVYNHGEYVLRKGMLNDYFYVVAFGSLEVMLEDNATGGSGGGMGHAAESKRRRSVATGIDLSSKVIAQIDVGDCVGEHSAINKGKCEASVRAKGSVELLLLPRHTMLRLIKRNKKVKARLHAMMHRRFSENLYLKTGKVTVSSAASILLKLKTIVAKWRDRRRARLEGRLPRKSHDEDEDEDEHAPAPASIEQQLSKSQTVKFGGAPVAKKDPLAA